MSLTVITECDNITICETITDTPIMDYVEKVMLNFDEQNNIIIYVVVNTGDKIISIKLK